MPPKSNEPDLNELLTIRDWLRFAVTCFSRAKLSYGHGTATAIDEAAFLILSTLDLPVDSLEPWLDFSSGYVQRSIADFPKQGSKAPWKLHQNYARDMMSLRFAALDDGVLTFS